MFIDARTIPQHTVIETELCIVGAGAAGITLARECINQPFRVCLLESGGLEYDDDTQSLHQGENTGLPYYPLVTTRLRYFGGTTNHWTGMCRPLDPIDFEVRSWIPYSGWPFARSHLDPFYERAHSICQLRPFTYDTGAWDIPDTPRFPLVSDRVITKMTQQSPPTRFGQVYRDEIERADNIITYLHANVVEIETTDTAQMVTRLRVACLQGPQFWVSAKHFILATGAIENARLLLLSHQVQSAGLGNQNDLVGRFFMEHPSFESGALLPSAAHLSTALDYSKPHRIQGVPVTRVLTLSVETLRREKLGNVSISLKPSAPEEISKGFQSLRTLVRNIRHRQIPDNFWKHVGNIITDIDDVAIGMYRKIVNPDYEVRMFHLNSQTEQIPNPESRVTLLTERDPLGMNRVGLNWRLSPTDKRTLRRAYEILGQEVGRAGVGRIRLLLGDGDDTTWPVWMRGGWHHMGTTRMHISPKQGVVNEHGQVHGISNLFIAGSSVFPTSGSAGPTLTIVALAIRLADHVKRLMTR